MIIIKTYYIEKVDKPKTVIHQIKKIEVKENCCKVYANLEKESNIEKVVKKFQQYDINNIVIEKSLFDNQKFIDYINSFDINIFEGKWLIKYLSFELLDFVIYKKQIIKQETEIAITVNEITDLAVETIKILASQYKKVTVVTNHINKIRKIEKNLYEQQGILIILSNNQKRSLIRPHIILNMDFNDEIINRYKINEKAVIINLEGNVRIESKRFEGININNYEIDVGNMEKFINFDMEKYNNKDIVESLIYTRDSFANIRKSISLYDIEIKDVYGIYGKIERFS